MMTPILIIAIMDFDGNVPEQERAILTEIFTEEAAKHFDGKIYTKNAVREMLLREERRLQVDKCDDAGCYAEISLALGAERLIEGSINRFGASLSMRASLIDAAKVEVSKRASLEWGGPAEGAPEAARALAQLLMIDAEHRRPGALLLSAETDGATVIVDGTVLGVSPMGRVDGLDVGVHQLLVEKNEHQPKSAYFVVKHGADTQMNATLERADPSIVERWWFWTIIGGVAVAGAATATGIVLSRRGEKPAPSGSIDVEWTLP